MMLFSVSVIIPVYNGDRFIEKAINSVLYHSEVEEIIVVNDGSTDSTKQIIEKLQKETSKIRIYNHPNQLNKGRSASRNLGIKKATSPFIAFLDADDFYLENRFKADKIHFTNNPLSDGVYNAIGVYFYPESTQEERSELELYSVKTKITPFDLFDALFFGKEGHFSIDGLTLKKTVFETVGDFTESLMVMEDTELFFKMALKCQLYTGIINKPVAIRGVHDTNVFNRADLYQTYTIKMYESLFFWCCKNKIPYSKIDLILKTLWIIRYKSEPSLLKNIGYWSCLFSKSPRILFSILAVKYFPVIRLRQKLFPFLFNK